MPPVRSSPSARSRPLPIVAGALALVGGLAPPTAAVADGTKPLPAKTVRIARNACTTSATDAQARAATFTVTMRALRRPATTFGFSVRLQERPAVGGRWATLKGARSPAGLGVFEAARAGSTRLVRKISVQGLRPGFRYRLLVRSRWVGGGEVRGGVDTSRSCTVADVRPDVGIGTAPILWTPGTAANQVVYRVPVTALGIPALGDRAVTLEIRQGDVVLTSTTYAPALADDVLLVAGRRCAADKRLQVVLDPEGLIDERDEANNVRSVPCQAAT